MKIKTIRWKKWLTVTAVLGMIALGPGFFGYQQRKWINTQFHLTGHRFGSGLPHELVAGKNKIGDSIEDVLKKYPQTHIPGTLGDSIRHSVGQWTWVSYGGSDLGGREMRIEFRAKNDKILEAYMVGSSYFFLSEVSLQ